MAQVEGGLRPPPPCPGQPMAVQSSVSSRGAGVQGTAPLLHQVYNKKRLEWVARSRFMGVVVVPRHDRGRCQRPWSTMQSHSEIHPIGTVWGEGVWRGGMGWGGMGGLCQLSHQQWRIADPQAGKCWIALSAGWERLGLRKCLVSSKGPMSSLVWALHAHCRHHYPQLGSKYCWSETPVVI